MKNKIGYDAVGEKCYKAIYKSDTPCAWCYFDELKAVKQNTEIKVKLKNRDYKITSSLLKENSKLTLYKDITYIKNITERLINRNIELKVINKIVKESETKFHKAQQKAQFGHWEYNVANDRLFWSGQIFKIFDVNNEKFTPTLKNWMQFIHLKDKNLIYTAYIKSDVKNLSSDIEHCIILKSGEARYLLLTSDCDYDKTGKVIRSFGMILDITKRKKTEHELLQKNNELIIAKEIAEQNKRRFKKLSDLTFESILIHKKETVIDANKAFSKKTGYKSKELVGNNIVKQIVPEKYRDIIISNIKNEYSLPYEIEIKRKDDKLIPVEVETVVVSEKEGVKVTAFRDLTIKKEAENRILSAIIMANPTVEELQNKEQFELIAELNHQQIKDFVLQQLSGGGKMVRIFMVYQLLMVLVGLFFLTRSVVLAFQGYSGPLFYSAAALVFCLSGLIVIHELLHGVALKIAGAKNISFGGYFKKFIFYAEADRFVLSRKQFAFIALTPLVVVKFIALTGIVIFLNSHLLYSLIVVMSAHSLFCAGDIGLLAIFSNHKKYEVYTFDVKAEKKSYYYKKLSNKL